MGRLISLEKIPHLPHDKAQPLHQAAQQSVGSLNGAVTESLVRDLVAQVRHCEHAEQNMRNLLNAAFADLPASGHRQLITIPGIGEATAAVLAAKIVDIDRFQTPDHLVGYFGVFPEENTSGVDKHGNPVPPGAMRMSPKGNDLVRSSLWNAARSAIRCHRRQHHGPQPLHGPCPGTPVRHHRASRHADDSGAEGVQRVRSKDD